MRGSDGVLCINAEGAKGPPSNRICERAGLRVAVESNVLELSRRRKEGSHVFGMRRSGIQQLYVSDDSADQPK
jgi:hypothetical protein